MQKDWLLAVGCSLTWGTEISQPRSSLKADKDHAWPAHLGRLLDATTVVNRGWPGRSNGSIFRIAVQDMVKYATTNGKNGIAVIQWTGPARLEIFNPYKIDVTGHHMHTTKGHHPGTEGSYLNITPSELGILQNENQSKPLFKSDAIAEYFLNFWANDMYQCELLFNNIVALNGIATTLGIQILHFNGIDELNYQLLPPHASHLSATIGKEFYNPTSRKHTFWATSYPVMASVPDRSKIYQLPPHPTADHHADWATILYDYLITCK